MNARSAETLRFSWGGLCARVACCVGAIVVALLAGGAGIARGALPAEGAGVISDGVEQIALFTPDGAGVVVYVPATGEQVGVTAALPANAQGRQYRWFTQGLIDARVYLAGVDPDRPPTTALIHDHIAVVDSAAGTFRWLCAPPRTLAGAGVPACLGQPFSGPELEIVQIGRRWISALTPGDRRRTFVRYSDAGGRFSQRFMTRAERRRFDRAVPTRSRNSPLNLDGERVTLDRRWGYRRSLSGTQRGTFGTSSYKGGQRAVLGRRADRRFAAVDILQATPMALVFVRFGTRGMCASTGARAILWDKSTRRIWRRPIAVDKAGHDISCTRSNVLMSVLTGFNFSGPGATLGPVWAWPTDADPAGWTRGQILRPGSKRSY